MTKTRRAAVAWGLIAALGACGGAGGGQAQPEAPAAIQLSASAVTFAATQAGGALPEAQVVTITNGGGGTLAAPTATVGAGAAWLGATVTPAAGGYALTLRPSTTALAEATYTATVEVAAPGAANSPLPVAVQWSIVGASGPVVAASPASLSFTTAAGSSPAPRLIALQNRGAATLAAATATPSFTTGSGWMTAAVSGSGNAQTVTVTVTPPGAGTYEGAISIVVEGAAGSPVRVPVSLTVQPASAGIADAFKIVALAAVDRQVGCRKLSSFIANGLAVGVTVRANAVAAAVAAGRLGWSQGQADACRAWIVGASCADVDSVGRPAACDGLVWGATWRGGGMLAGKVANGGACMEHIECADGWCAVADACPGRCTPFKAPGAACTGPDCGPGNRCSSEGSGPATCKADVAPAGNGEPCSRGSRACQPGLYCDGNSCVPRGGAGATCSTVVNDACQPGFACVASGAATTGLCGAALVAEGGACGPSVTCGQGSYCSASTHTCVGLPSLGQACAEAGACVDSTYCLGSTSPVCTAGTAGKGAPCTSTPDRSTAASMLCTPGEALGRFGYCNRSGSSSTCGEWIVSCY
jgi:hypothetical protein